MPTVELVQEGAPILCPMQGRSKGDHVSVLVHELCLELGHYKEDDGEVNQARLELGNAWEYALINRLQLDDPDRYIQPGELELDGVYGTPDILDMVEKADCEIKCSFMSCKHGPGSDKFFKYETQLKAYLHMLATPKHRWLVGYLHVCFVMGDYKYGSPTSGPVYRIWRYVFTPQELEMNWKMLMNQAKRGAATRTRS